MKPPTITHAQESPEANRAFWTHLAASHLALYRSCLSSGSEYAKHYRTLFREAMTNRREQTKLKPTYDMLIDGLAHRNVA